MLERVDNNTLTEAQLFLNTALQHCHNHQHITFDVCCLLRIHFFCVRVIAFCSPLLPVRCTNRCWGEGGRQARQQKGFVCSYTCVCVRVCVCLSLSRPLSRPLDLSTSRPLDLSTSLDLSLSTSLSTSRPLFPTRFLTTCCSHGRCSPEQRLPALLVTGHNVLLIHVVQGGPRPHARYSAARQPTTGTQTHRLVLTCTFRADHTNACSATSLSLSLSLSLSRTSSCFCHRHDQTARSFSLPSSPLTTAMHTLTTSTL